MSSSDDESDVSCQVDSDEDEDDEDSDESGHYALYDYMDDNGQSNLNKMLSLRENVNWQLEEERVQFFTSLWHLIDSWVGALPDLRDIFSPLEIDWLLARDLKNARQNDYRTPIITFVMMSGYKDEAEYDDDGAPLLRRATPIHQAARCDILEFPELPELVESLFRMYNIHDLNYVDESGLTHVHVACMYGCENVIEVFFIFEKDPNCVWRETGDSPLHLALAGDHEYIANLLLRNGADPNAANLVGSTPLHVVCEESGKDDLAEKFFKSCDNKHETVQVDVKDSSGRTPLQLAVANFLPNTVELLLNRGADLSSFVFPDESYFGEKFLARHVKNKREFKLKLASGVMAVVACLEKSGYELDRSDALRIMKLFSAHGLFKTSSANDEIVIVADETKKYAINSSLSLYDVVRLPPEKAAKLPIAHTDYYKFACTKKLRRPLGGSYEACVGHLCETVSRGFFRCWALDHFLVLTSSHRLPSECCEIIIGRLLNQDLWHICLAATGQSS